MIGSVLFSLSFLSTLSICGLIFLFSTIFFFSLVWALDCVTKFSSRYPRRWLPPHDEAPQPCLFTDLKTDYRLANKSCSRRLSIDEEEKISFINSNCDDDDCTMMHITTFILPCWHAYFVVNGNSSVLQFYNLHALALSPSSIEKPQNRGYRNFPFTFCRENCSGEPDRTVILLASSHIFIHETLLIMGGEKITWI